MATVTSTLKLQDKMTSAFNSIQKAAKNTGNSFDNVSNKLDNMNNKMQKVSSTTSSVVKGILGASIIQKVFRYDNWWFR